MNKGSTILTLDFEKGKQLRDEGIRVSSANAERVEPGWNERAFDVLKDFLATRSTPFLAEDVRFYATLQGMKEPPNNRAWGGIMRKAAFQGLIERKGFGTVSNPTAHACYSSLWQRV